MVQVLRRGSFGTTKTVDFPEKIQALLYLCKYLLEMFVQILFDKLRDCTQHPGCANPLRTEAHLIEYFQKGVSDTLLFLCTRPVPARQPGLSDRLPNRAAIPISLISVQSGPCKDLPQMFSGLAV